MALNLDQIRVLAQRVAASHGLDLVEVEYQGAAKYRTLRIFIEKNAEERAKLAAKSGEASDESAPLPEGFKTEQLAGITHDDCTAFSRDFGTVLDVEELVPGAEYTLEVSSPGLDRKLYSAADYQRFSGSLVKLQTFTAVSGNRHWQGRIAQVGDRGITVDLSALKQKGKGKKANQAVNKDAVEIEFSNIEKASLIPEF
ncbi:ribosome maturation factor RimP [Silvibacterium bohemicum]|uniref:Ribosome maturation factor RimP n=1 Tax=Silvibacterium bohemicum TaxID=1577686 RepID=A0A841JY20_9BACT|nr:ribosome maturation factor RimP [Silvibacterium bohemicum]MBB6144629.1 ribosome maturation factor RimP [Silvibacterium bohemicum]